MKNGMKCMKGLLGRNATIDFLDAIA